MSKNQAPVAPVAPAETPAVAPVEVPVVEPVAEAAPAPEPVAEVAPVVTPLDAPAVSVPVVPEPVVLNKDTTIETIRAPFSGTVVTTNDQVQVAVQAETDFTEVDLGNGTVVRTYTGLQPGVELVTSPVAEAE